MSQPKIHLFKKFSVQADGQEITYLRSQKVQELFCYLLIYQSQAHHRAVLADQLWGTMKIGNTKTYLRKALWQLQVSLNLVSERLAEKILRIDSEWLRIDLRDSCWMDISHFEWAHKQVKGIRGSDLDHRQYLDLKSAVDLYEGDLLIGWYQDWCIFERERYKEMLLEMVNKLMGYCEANHDFETGIEYGDMLLRFDRAHERTHRRLMRIHYLSGNRAMALRQFEKCKQALKEELSVEPSRVTYQLFAQIRDEEEKLLAEPVAATKPDSTQSLLSVVESLSRIKKRLAKQVSDQKKLFAEIQALEDALNKPY